MKRLIDKYRFYKTNREISNLLHEYLVGSSTKENSNIICKKNSNIIWYSMWGIGGVSTGLYTGYSIREYYFNKKLKD